MQLELEVRSIYVYVKDSAFPFWVLPWTLPYDLERLAWLYVCTQINLSSTSYSRVITLTVVPENITSSINVVSKHII